MKYFLTALFFAFICWIIYQADTGASSIFFKITRSIPYGDKAGHFLLFGVLAFMVNSVFVLRAFPFAGFNIQAGGVLVLFFSLAEELSQFFFSGRTVDVVDAIFDVLGIVFFSYVSLWIYGRNIRNKDEFSIDLLKD